jgi:hypothetical protein
MKEFNTCEVQYLNAAGEWCHTFKIDDLEDAKRGAKDYSKMVSQLHRVVRNNTPVVVYLNGEVYSP